jgi:hypothetical protein
MAIPTSSVRFAPLQATGTGPPVIAPGYYMVEPTRAYNDDEGRVEVLPFTVTIANAEVVTQIPVTPLDFSWVWKVTGQLFTQGGVRTVGPEYIQVPLSGAILDFEDLTRVDPATLHPLVVVTPTEEARLEAIEAAIAAGVASGGAPAGTGTAGRLRVLDLQDITSIGIALGTATNQPDARLMIGAGTSDVVIGTAGGTAADAAAVAAALAGKAPVDTPTFTGPVTVPDASFSVAKVSGLAAALAGLVGSTAVTSIVYSSSPPTGTATNGVLFLTPVV